MNTTTAQMIANLTAYEAECFTQMNRSLAIVRVLPTRELREIALHNARKANPTGWDTFKRIMGHEVYTRVNAEAAAA